MKNRKILLLTAASLVAVLVLLLVLAFAGGDSSEVNEEIAITSVFSRGTEPVTTAFSPTDGSFFFSVKAPEHATVLFDGQEIEYNKVVGLYQIFSDDKGPHSLSVSKYGFETVTRELDSHMASSSEVVIEMKATEEYIAEAEAAAEKYLYKITDICNSGIGELSDISFHDDRDRAVIQAVVDAVIADTDVDSEDYITSDISISSCISKSLADTSKTITADNSNAVVSFIVEYTYSWEYNGEAYCDSGVDSQIINPVVTLESIDGTWCLKDIYINLRKLRH